MTGTRRRYTREFKREAIRLYETSGKSVRQVESDLGITTGLLNKWRSQQRHNGQHAFVGSGHPTELEAELRRLRRENEILRQERDILKKKSWRQRAMSWQKLEHLSFGCRRLKPMSRR